MAIYIYRSTDTDAPVLSNTAGTLLTVLDACLVNGYGEKTALGWTIEQTDTNLRTYRPSTGNRRYFAIDDTTTTYATLRMFETVTSAGTSENCGTYPCPKNYQQSGGVNIPKVGGSARPWVLISNGTFIFLYTDYSNDTTGGVMTGFGDFPSYRYNDTGNTIIIGGGTSQTGSGMINYLISPTTACNYHYVYKRYDNIGYSVPVGKMATNGLAATNATTMGNNAGTFFLHPDPLRGSLFLTQFYIIEPYALGTYGVVRGIIPGLWALAHRAEGYTNGDIIIGEKGSKAEGKTFEVFLIYGSYQNMCLIETSDTWDELSYR